MAERLRELNAGHAAMQQQVLAIGGTMTNVINRIGLVEPQRTSGNQRMYSRREVERVQRIRNLMDDLGVNLAGVEVVIKVLERLQQAEVEKTELKDRVQVLERQLAIALQQA